MPGWSFKGAMSTGHACWWPNFVTGGSSNVFVNYLPVARVGDMLSVHCCPFKGCHPDFVASGQWSVLVNMRPVATIGSKCAPGGRLIFGSYNVSSGGGGILGNLTPFTGDFLNAAGVQLPVFNSVSTGQMFSGGLFNSTGISQAISGFSPLKTA